MTVILDKQWFFRWFFLLEKETWNWKSLDKSFSRYMQFHLLKNKIVSTRDEWVYTLYLLCLRNDFFNQFTFQGQRNICECADWSAPDFKTMLYDQFMIYKMVHFEQQGVQDFRLVRTWIEYVPLPLSRVNINLLKSCY